MVGIGTGTDIPSWSRCRNSSVSHKRSFGVAALAEPTNREVPLDAHAPHVVTETGLEPLDASGVVTPLLECLPSHGRIFAERDDHRLLPA